MSDVAAIELVREQAGRFLGYRGALLALPFGWEAWNAYRSRALVGSLAVSSGSAGSFDWAEADYEGPFFAPGSSPSLLDPAALVARMECVYIAPGLRGGELWSRYEAILAGLGLPVYAAFANPRLGERFRAADSPAGYNIGPVAHGRPSFAKRVIPVRGREVRGREAGRSRPL